ncbi:MAG TPA: hypothetical protein IAB20_06440 [Candidatus Pullichristensenella excrementipullorum]|nr:hypothetical protein [Candidatus Pullichristensenella excrementipullorum]
MTLLTQMAAQLTALCALSAAVELLLGDAAEKRGVRFLVGLMALLVIARAAGAVLG